MLPPKRHASTEIELGLVTNATTALGLDLARARAIAAEPNREKWIVVVAVDFLEEEMYLAARLPPTIPTSIALVELSRIMAPILITALVAAGLMAFLVYRQLLPSLNALAELADEPRTTPEGLSRPDAPNEIVEIALRFRDTTRMLRDAREKAERQRDELEKIQSSLIRASKLASVGRLAAGIAHEIGNPLAAIRGYLSLMKEGLPEPQRNDALGRSIRELGRIHDIIEKLLTYARTGTEIKHQPEAFGLSLALDEALSLAHGHPSLRGVEIRNRVPSDGLQVLGQAGRFGQVLINLLLNAGQAMSGRELRTITISRTVETHAVHLQVEDTGPGIEPGHLESVFDPFFTTKDPGEGTGLGLAVSRALMEAMAGSLDVRSELGEGAVFSIRIPKVQSAEDRPRQNPR